MRPGELDAFLAELDAWAAQRTTSVVTLQYGPHAEQVLDLRLADNRAERPLLLVIHGGFWRAPYTRRSTAALSVAFAALGYATANVEYRRLGPGAYQPMLDDLRAARARLSAFGTTVAIGHSAGGHLALWLAAEGAVAAAVALGGVCDLGAAARAGLGNGAVQEFLGGSQAEVPEAYAAADPAARLPLGRPQVLVHGNRDDRVPIDHARRYHARARAAGDDCSLVELDAGHFEPIDPRSAAWPALVAAVAGLERAQEPG